MLDRLTTYITTRPTLPLGVVLAQNFNYAPDFYVFKLINAFIQILRFNSVDWQSW